mgnify:CR=1 FL=1
MPLYMDVHHDLGEVTPADLQAAHERDLEVQDRHSAKFLTYWLNDKAGRAFCLVEAPSAEMAIAVHKESHGLLPHKIIEVETPTVEQFLGDWQGFVPGAAMVGVAQNDNGLRAIMFTDLESSVALTTRLGDAGAMDVLRKHNGLVRDCLASHGGREVKHTGDGVMASFASASRAVECAISIQRTIVAHNVGDVNAPLHLRVGLSAGEPVEESNDLFGASVQLAARLCAHAGADQILTAGVVRDLCIGKTFAFGDMGTIALKGFPEPVRVFEVNWREA